MKTEWTRVFWETVTIYLSHLFFVANPLISRLFLPELIAMQLVFKSGHIFHFFSFSVSRSTMSITQGNKIMETLYLTGYFLTQNDLRRCHCSTSLCLSICPSLQYHNYLSLSTITHLLDVKLPYDSVFPSIASLIGLLHGLSFIISYKFIHSSFLNYTKTDKIDYLIMHTSILF